MRTLVLSTLAAGLAVAITATSGVPAHARTIKPSHPTLLPATTRSAPRNSGDGLRHAQERQSASPDWGETESSKLVDGYDDYYGQSVASSGKYAVVGTPLGGDGGNGAAYVYVRIGATWDLIQDPLEPPPGNLDVLFGMSVAISGNTLIVSATGPNCDSPVGYVYGWAGNYWAFRQRLVGSAQNMVCESRLPVALSGNYAVLGWAAGNAQHGEADVFRRVGGANGSWVPDGILYAPAGTDGEFGLSVGITSGWQGVPYAFVGAPTAGRVYVFHRDVNGTWPQTPVALSGPGSYNFGDSLAYSGGYLLVGSPGTTVSSVGGAGNVYSFHFESGVLQPKGQLIAPDGPASSDRFGSSLAIAGTRALIGAPGRDGDTGAAFAYILDGGVWMPQQKLIASDRSAHQNLGSAVAVVASGAPNLPRQALVGAPGDDFYSVSGAVYVFGGDGYGWYQNNFDTGVAIPSQNFEASFDMYDVAAADDFTVPVKKAKITSVDVTGQYYNGSGPARDETVTFYRDSRGAPGDVVKTLTVRGTDNGTGSFHLAFVKRVKLAQGTYWMSVVANMDVATGGQWGWEVRGEQTARAAMWENPGDGWGTGCTTYKDMQGCVGYGPDLMFEMSG